MSILKHLKNKIVKEQDIDEEIKYFLRADE